MCEFGYFSLIARNAGMASKLSPILRKSSAAILLPSAFIVPITVESQFRMFNNSRRYAYFKNV